MKTKIKIGFVPLVDCASLVIAWEKGYFAEKGLDVELRKFQSWGQIREKLIAGEIDAAHLLITMPLQCALEAGSQAPPICYAFALSRHGNGIVVSNALWKEGAESASVLGAWMLANAKASLRFGVVHPRSTHEYFLRSWLATGGMEVGGRIALKIIPPQEMVGRLRKREVDGFCVGDPWSRRAAASKLGRVVAVSGAAWNGMPEKVLGVSTAWHASHAREHGRLIQALSSASAWLDEPVNRMEAMEILASKKYVNTAKTNLADSAVRFFQGGVNLASEWHAAWYLEQMRKCGHVDEYAAKRLDLRSICLESFHREILPGINH